jgi:CubicO group peptidase (beta-lactamase class C family)
VTFLFGTAARVGLSVFVALSLSGCLRFRAESRSARVDRLFTAWNGKDTPGCAVGVSRNGAILYEHGYGMANLELGVPITADTVFALASITKSFTAMSVMLAVQQGKLSLEDDVQKYIPEWTDRDHHITIHHLLSHTSGLRDAFGLLGWAEPGDSADNRNETIVGMLARQRGVNFPPGTEYQYNNGGYALLASILERATGQSLRGFADANIFKPLGMTHTHVHDDLPTLVPNRASGYSRNDSGWRVAKQDGGIVGNAGMYSTVGDLLRWEDNFENPLVGTREMFATMEKPVPLPGGKTSSYGLGSRQYRGLRVIGHNGGDYGIATNATRYPDQRFAVTVLCNIDQISMGGTTTIDPEALANSVADIYLGDVLAPPEAAPKPTLSARAVKLSDADLSDKAGLYRMVPGEQPLLFTVSNSTLMLRSYFGDDVDLVLTPINANRFLLLERIPFEFMPAAAGRPREWRVGQGNDQKVAQPVTLVLPETELRGYAGAYRSDELRTTYTLEARGSKLVVERSRPDVTITPFSKDVFVGDGVGVVRFSRDSRGAVNSFTVNRDNVRGVRFDRTQAP